jgi:hypothetical protein
MAPAVCPNIGNAPAPVARNAAAGSDRIKARPVRPLLKFYVVSLLCFALPGTFVLYVYTTGYDNWHNKWSVATPQPLPLLVLWILLGFLAYCWALIEYALGLEGRYGLSEGSLMVKC